MLSTNDYQLIIPPIYHYLGVSENVVYPFLPNGFADQTIPFLNGYFIGKINPTFSDKSIYYW